MLGQFNLRLTLLHYSSRKAAISQVKSEERCAISCYLCTGGGTVQRHLLRFPDFYTRGEDLTDALFMAQDILAGVLSGKEEQCMNPREHRQIVSAGHAHRPHRHTGRRRYRCMVTGPLRKDRQEDADPSPAAGYRRQGARNTFLPGAAGCASRSIGGMRTTRPNGRRLLPSKENINHPFVFIR